MIVIVCLVHFVGSAAPADKTRLELNDFPDGVDSCGVVQKWLHLPVHSHDVELVKVQNVNESQSIGIKLDLLILQTIPKIVDNLREYCGGKNQLVGLGKTQNHFLTRRHTLSQLRVKYPIFDQKQIHDKAPGHKLELIEPERDTHGGDKFLARQPILGEFRV